MVSWFTEQAAWFSYDYARTGGGVSVLLAAAAFALARHLTARRKRRAPRGTVTFKTGTAAGRVVAKRRGRHA